MTRELRCTICKFTFWEHLYERKGICPNCGDTALKVLRELPIDLAPAPKPPQTHEAPAEVASTPTPAKRPIRQRISNALNPKHKK